MNLESFVWTCQAKNPVVIVLRPEDYEELAAALPKTPGEWNREKMTFRGAPIVRGEWRSYIVEDAPEMPLIHVVG